MSPAEKAKRIAECLGLGASAQTALLHAFEWPDQADSTVLPLVTHPEKIHNQVRRTFSQMFLMYLFQRSGLWSLGSSIKGAFPSSCHWGTCSMDNVMGLGG